MRTERYSAVEEDEEPEFTAAAAGEALEVVIGRPESGEDSEEGIHVRDVHGSWFTVLVRQWIINVNVERSKKIN